MKRYQECRWPIRLWRRRYYLPIPFKALRIWLAQRRRPVLDNEDWQLSFSTCWSLCIGLAQAKMNWFYDWDEVKQRIQERIARRTNQNLKKEKK
jgi:hypothetical protein